MQQNFVQKFLLGAAFVGAATLATAQAPAAQPAPAPAIDHSYKPMTLKLNESGSKYIRFLTWHQVWTSFTENNPGTTDVNGNDISGKYTFDVAMRRSRFLVYSQVSPRFLILSHWGINNQSFINGGAGAGSNVTSAGASNAAKRPQLYIHDAWTEFAVEPGKLHIGAGLHYWNGVSRLSNNSTLNFMTMDAPIFNWYNIEATDQFARQYGIYAKGQLGKLDYRVSLNKPFVNGTAGTAMAVGAEGTHISANALNEKTAIQGYFKYMLWDKESNMLPFEVGTYLGTKKVLNIGVGFYSHPEAMASRYKRTAGDTVVTKYNETILGADVFLDMPLDKAKGTAVNFLLTYYNMDFGPRYLRNIGILNEHTNPVATATSWAGAGNTQPTIGTGNIIYAQAGYLLPKLKSGHQVMPYATYTYKDFERIGKSSGQFGLGVNYFVNGHFAKITAEYATRPLYKLTNNVIERNGSAGQFTIQTHIFL
jgi:hypothetical protein